MDATSEDIYIRVARSDINFVNQIMEGYEYLGLMSTFDREAGIQIIRATSDTRDEVLAILKSMPCQVQILAKTEAPC